MAIGFLRRSQGDWVIGQGTGEWLAERPSGSPAFYAPDFFLCAERPWLRLESVRNASEFALPTTDQKLNLRGVDNPLPEKKDGARRG